MLSTMTFPCCPFIANGKDYNASEYCKQFHVINVVVSIFGSPVPPVEIFHEQSHPVDEASVHRLQK